MDMLLGWFDLNGVSAPIGPAGGPQLSLFEQVLLYIVVIAGGGPLRGRGHGPQR
jgi:hypothetical protein